MAGRHGEEPVHCENAESAGIADRLQNSLMDESGHMRVLDPTLFFWCIIALIIFVAYRAMKPRPDDYRVIEHLMKIRGLRTISIARTRNYARYWKPLGFDAPHRTARIYIALGEEAPGLLREFHVGFDDWPRDGRGPRILLERQRPAPEACGPRGGPSA